MTAEAFALSVGSSSGLPVFVKAAVASSCGKFIVSVRTFERSNHSGVWQKLTIALDSTSFQHTVCKHSGL